MSTLLPTFSALGTIWAIEIFGEISTEKRQIIFDDLTFFISQFEQTYSRFRPDSLLSTLNQNRIIENTPTDFIETIKFGIKMYDSTDGVMNIMVGDALNAIGYDSKYSFIPTAEKVTIPNPNEAISVSGDTIKLNSGSIDIGGYGKGLLIDMVKSRLITKHFIPYFLINGGGDIYATSDSGQPIEIYLEHPTETNSYLASTVLYNQGFAASSPHKRSWIHNNSSYSHIIQTTNIDNDKSIDTTFIKAPTAVTADIFATVALMVGTDKMTQFIQRENLAVATYSVTTKKLLFSNNFGVKIS